MLLTWQHLHTEDPQTAIIFAETEYHHWFYQKRSSMHNIVEITTTLETKEQAQKLANELVTKRLAACVQISGPIESVYSWQGKICNSAEYRCTIKTIAELQDRLLIAIREEHPYDVPEILVTEVSASSEAYGRWLQAQVLNNEG